MLKKDDWRCHGSRGCGHVIDPLLHLGLVQGCWICLEDADLNVNNDNGCTCWIELTHKLTYTLRRANDRAVPEVRIASRRLSCYVPLVTRLRS
jgi:hypothetical protein